ncbi:MAG: cation transporter [Betaproteobacteria bacterium]|nr:cation transporter [Betaproteobacteria bacterium]
MSRHDHPHGHDHAHGHDHDHAHDHDPARGLHIHDHDHAVPDNSRVFALGAALNIAFVVVEVVAGLWADSLALLADAGHNFGDVLGLLLAGGAVWLSRRAPTARFTYGLQGSTILAALANAMLLILAVGAIGWEAIGRLRAPVPVPGTVVMAVAAVGIVVNAFTAWLFMRDRERDLNARGAYLHMVADAAVSAGVVLSGLVIVQTGWLWLDPAVSLLIAAAILWGTWGLLKDSVHLSLQGVPRQVNMARVRTYLSGLAGVQEVHDLHVWAMSTSQNAMTVHLVMPGGHPGDQFLESVMLELAAHYGIDHPTFQIEKGDGLRPCALAPEHVV